MNYECAPIKFHKTVPEVCNPAYFESLIHIVCLSGSFTFKQNGKHYNALPSTYTIFPNPVLVSDVVESDDFSGYVFTFPWSFAMSMVATNNVSVQGQLSLLLNPVITLDERSLANCCELLEILRRRSERAEHLYGAKMMSNLLSAHILDIYDIHARLIKDYDISHTVSSQLRQFIALLSCGEYLVSRSPAYYAEKLCITAHYLTDICRKVSGKPSTYWIDRFAVNEITRLLSNRNLSLSEISDRMGFSSLSYFSRYVLKHLGITPSQFRQRLNANQ